MYLTITEIADYLSLPEATITKLVDEQRIRAVYDGEQYLINRDQFSDHLKNIEKAKKEFEEWRNEPIPESFDVKDED